MGERQPIKAFQSSFYLGGQYDKIDSVIQYSADKEVYHVCQRQSAYGPAHQEPGQTLAKK